MLNTNIPTEPERENIMNRFQVAFAAIALIAANAASAQSAPEAIPAAFQRADVVAATANPAVAAVREGAAKVAAAGLTREQVRAEFLAARASGQNNPFDTDGFVQVAPASRTANGLAQAY
ncbi:MAG: hypothetical protein CFE46_01950 [Burkholderiales bacterium PBB6]|nr:MAG: hypothetical protein CFE46_01950 [Burkholderiales bacterium PBB6]